VSFEKDMIGVMQRAMSNEGSLNEATILTQRLCRRDREVRREEAIIGRRIVATTIRDDDECGAGAGYDRLSVEL
jgi:hypothetical protein